MFNLQLCNCPPNNVRDTIIDIKANKIELQIEDILSEVSVLSKVFILLKINYCENFFFFFSGVFDMISINFSIFLCVLNFFFETDKICFVLFSFRTMLCRYLTSTQKSDNGSKQFARISKR